MDVYIIMKDNKPCQICYNTLPRKAMQFHHIDGRDKKFNISDGVKNCLGWIPSIIPEMKKCIFICGNCHATIHDKKLSISEVKLLIKYQINNMMENLQLVGCGKPIYIIFLKIKKTIMF